MSEITNTMESYRTFRKGNIIPPTYPMANATVQQGFNDTTSNFKGHLGYDLTHPDGKARSLFDGKIALINSSNRTRPNGVAVCVEHTIGSTVFYSTYCHLDSVRSDLSVGDLVSRNEEIGVIGNTSNNANMATHLHLCVFTASGPNDNPMGYCGGTNHTFEEMAGEYANEYYYGPDNTKFPNCYGLCFYDPYAVVSTNGAVLRYSEYSIYDVNRDGVVDQRDVTRAQRYFGAYDPICDIDGDGEVTVNDLILILNHIDNT